MLRYDCYHKIYTVHDDCKLYDKPVTKITVTYLHFQRKLEGKYLNDHRRSTQVLIKLPYRVSENIFVDFHFSEQPTKSEDKKRSVKLTI